MAEMHGTRLLYLRSGFTVLEMAEEFDKLFKDMGNDIYIWKMAKVFEKRLNYVGNDLDVWDMAQICGEMT